MPALAEPNAREFLGALAAAHAELSGPAAGVLGEAYRGATIDRLNANWVPHTISGDDAIGQGHGLVTARIRDQARNESVMKAAPRALCTGIVGTGIQTFAESYLGPEELNDVYNAESDSGYEYWCEQEADAEGKLAWQEMEWLHFNEVVTTGEGLMLRCADPDRSRSVPICYQLLEAEQLDESMDRPAGPNQNKIVRGVEIGPRNKPVAYWLFDAHPNDSHSLSRFHSERIPAERVIHTFLPGRPSETRGISWFTTLIQSARDLDWYVGNELTAAAIGALLSVMINRKDGAAAGTGLVGAGAASGAATDVYGNQTFRMARGAVFEGGPEDKATIVESNRPNRDAGPFIDLLLKLGGMGAGVSRLRLTRDYSESSYTSARGAHLDDDAYFKPIQKWLGRSVCLPTRRDVNRQLVAYGRIPSLSPQKFLAAPARYQRFSLQPPGRDQLDPTGETDAAAARIRYCLSDWEQECGARGTSFRRTVLKQKQQRAFAARHGVPLDLSSNPQTSASQADRDAAAMGKTNPKKTPQEAAR